MSAERLIYVEYRTNGRDIWFAVACDLCEWWDDDNETYHGAMEVGLDHFQVAHPDAIPYGFTRSNLA